MSSTNPHISFVFDIHYGPETVVLQFKDEVGIFKSFADEFEAHRLDAGEYILFYQNAEWRSRTLSKSQPSVRPLACIPWAETDTGRQFL